MFWTGTCSTHPPSPQRRVTQRRTYPPIASCGACACSNAAVRARTVERTSVFIVGDGRNCSSIVVCALRTPAQFNTHTHYFIAPARSLGHPFPAFFQMTTELFDRLLAEGDETTAGNYFVAN